MLDFILAPENLPFAVALVLMAMIGLVEALGLGLGAVDMDMGADAQADGDFLGWLGVGTVPLLVLIIVLLALFGLIGLTVQQVANALTGSPLSPRLAVPAALVAALPLTGAAARALARILPKDETTAVDIATLVGKRATVTVGVARRGFPAQARVRDAHGQSHYVMVEPSGDQQTVTAGETMLLVRREEGIFIGLYEGEALAPLDDRSALGRN